MHKNSEIFFLPNELSTLEFGSKLAKICPKKCLIYLQGNLGAGKTTLVRGFLQGLGYQGKVKSPTYTLVEEYRLGTHLIFHFDLYRLITPEELNDIGIEDYFAESAIHLIEWPERGGNMLPPPDLTCYIRASDAGREINITINSRCATHITQQLTNS